MPAVSRAVRVLEAVAAHPDGLGISQIARVTGLSKSSVHGLVNALGDEGLLASTEGLARYRLGPRLALLASSARETAVLGLARSALSRLTQAAGETALFGRLTGDRVRILAIQQSNRPLTISAQVGSSLPVAAGALGKAYAALDPSAVPAMMPRFTDWTIVDTDAYGAEVEATRERGFALDVGEYLPGIAAVAVALAWEGATYFFWVVTIDAGGGTDSLLPLGAELRRTTTALAEQLGGEMGRESRSA